MALFAVSRQNTECLSSELNEEAAQSILRVLKKLVPHSSCILKSWKFRRYVHLPLRILVGMVT